VYFNATEYTVVLRRIFGREREKVGEGIMKSIPPNIIGMIKTRGI
jgi:hypothetical protein